MYFYYIFIYDNEIVANIFFIFRELIKVKNTKAFLFDILT